MKEWNVRGCYWDALDKELNEKAELGWELYLLHLGPPDVDGDVWCRLVWWRLVKNEEGQAV